MLGPASLLLLNDPGFGVSKSRFSALVSRVYGLGGVRKPPESQNLGPHEFLSHVAERRSNCVKGIFLARNSDEAFRMVLNKACAK